MGHKKRNVVSRFKTPPSSSVSGGDGGPATHGIPSSTESEQSLISNSPMEQQKKSKIEPLVVESDGSAFSEIKLECERALTALRRGNHTKALRLMKEMSVKHQTSALIHRVQGTVCVKVASIIDDPNAKQRHLKNAIESARKSVSLSPNSIEFAHFYANLLYEAANDGKEYEDVVQECERALGIENPVDPAKESLQDEKEQKILTAEARIEHMQNEIRSLIQKSNIASISTWMKNLGNGEEKFRLIPIRRVSEDPMEVRLVQAKRPNEIKKATKTLEEKRKEIEVRVAAARLLQQKSESQQLQNNDNKALDSSSGSGQRVGERRKSGNMRKSASSAEGRDWVRSYWNSISLDMKKDLLRLKISELKAHFNSFKDNLSYEVLSEAVSFAEGNRTWSFWICCDCHEKFVDSESHMQHVLQEHLGNLWPKMQSILPQNVDNEWIEMLLKCSWKPLDINAAVKMCQNQLKFHTPELLSELYPRNYIEDFKDCLPDSYCSEDACDLSPQGEKFMDCCNGNTVQCKSYEKVSDSSWRCDGNQGGKPYFLPGSWPLSEDTERAKLLEKIHATFQVLIRHKYLAASHVHKVMQYTVDELQRLASGSQLLNFGVEQTPVCICFLGASELKKVLKYLQELSQSCGIGRYSEKSGAADNLNTGTQGDEITEKIVLNDDSSCLLLDENFLPCHPTSSPYHGIVTDGATSSNVGCEKLVLLDADSLLSWIFTSLSIGEQLGLWTCMREEKAHQGKETLQTLEKDFDHLQSMYERKCEHLSYEEALQAVEDLCLEEGKKRVHVTEFVHQSYETVLRKRREELIESDKDVMFISSRYELDALSNVLKEAEALNVNQFGYEETYSGVTNHLCELESVEDDDSRTKDYLHQVDSCIEVAIQRQKEQLATELGKLDARMMRNLTELQNMEAKLEAVSALDYRSILVPLVKSFMRVRLEDLAEKYATEKSDAAREAFLAELALDSKKGTGGGSENSRQAHEKTRDKKKNKENRKTKDSKANDRNGLMFQHKTAECCSFPVVSSEDHPDSEIVVSVPGTVLKQHYEEEFRRKIELEAEERKLEETLEYQRRIEKEAKQKHLAEQHKKITGTIPEKHSDDNQDVHEQLKYCKQVSVLVLRFSSLVGMEPLTQRNGFINALEVAYVNTSDRSSQRIGNACGQHLTNAKQGLTNEAIPEDGGLSFDRRTGKKGRRQKSANTKYQTDSSGKENGEGGQIKNKDALRSDDNKSCARENGTKTLRQLQAEDDDEERFQADLKKAVRQSLDTFHAHQKFPLVSSLKMSHKVSSEVDDLDVSLNEVPVENVNGADVYGTGLKNEVGEYNCFLNVIIQSLWHLRRFRDDFLGRSTINHVHVGDPCVTCALYDIFSALGIASVDIRREAVAPTSLRNALSNLYPDSNFFQEGQMNDASEVLGVIFECLHRSFTSGLGVSDTESVESNCTGSWDCANTACIAHSLFGMDIFERMNCCNCESSFDELVNLVEMNHQLACDPEAGGCGKLNHIHHILSAPPHVFTTVLGWQNTCESAEDIKATLAALATEVDVGVLYRGLDPNNRHCLASVVCYYGQHYHCFAYSHDHECWVMYDDKTVKVIGGWDNVLTMCERGLLQPQVLFFEAVR
ncbi:ubiquitin carboxyl-terminal hydrolase-related protein [Actinidia rufa]|uniref:Ubiquitin carboxyl-terminal hydrolase-related protein n=1 Tax=Actinidia rufa TaxID=165716 RepID=A0A7J0GAD6_9ERIC|nr:ubiquitin carboxyl-terminal hydrolase-related protein [Actinidia rufa]